MVKKVSVLDDSLVYQKLPGNSGRMSVNGASVNDTVLGQNFNSELVTIKSWEISAPAFYKGIPGYNLIIKKGGTPTAMTDEATTLVDTLLYQITNTAKRLIDLDTAVVVEDNAVTVDPEDIEYIDYLWGRVKFVTGYVVAGAITVTGAYVPLATLGFGRTVNLSQTSAPIDISEYDNTQASSGFRNQTYGLQSVAASVAGIYNASQDFALQVGATNLILEINPDGQGLSKARGYFQLMTDELDGEVGATENESLSFVLTVPNEEKLLAPFKWDHDPATTLDDAVLFCLNAWESATNVTVKYEPVTTGVGHYGAAVITDISMANDVEGQTEFSIVFTGTDNLLTL